MSDVRVLPMGPRAVLVESDLDPAALADVLRALVPDAVDVVPAARTVLVTVRHALRPGDLAELADTVRTTIDSTPVAGGDVSEPVIIPVRYDGADLDAVAAQCGLSVTEVVRRHTAATYRVAFCGFAPGFAYLSGLDPSLHLPRRPTPRPRVPAGSVAVAATFSAVYPTVSPGGWHLLGRTDVAVWDVERRPPALLAPGTPVRFVEAP